MMSTKSKNEIPVLPPILALKLTADEQAALHEYLSAREAVLESDIQERICSDLKNPNSKISKHIDSMLNMRQRRK